MERARKVRLAMALTIPREDLVESILGGFGKVNYTTGISVDDPLFQERWGFPYDPQQAKQLLRDAGYPNGFNAEMWVGPSGTNVELGEVLASVWQTELGINLTLDKVVYSSFRPTLVNRTNTKLVPFGDTMFPSTWPYGNFLSAISSPGFGHSIEIPKATETFLNMSKASSPEELTNLITQWYDYNREWVLKVGVWELSSPAVYNPRTVTAWEMYPTVSNLGGVWSMETVILAP